MRKFSIIAIPIVTITVFILIMLSGNILKYSFGNDDNVTGLVNELIKNINEENWEEAHNNTDKLNLVWVKIVNRVQFSSERDEINAFSMNIARLRGTISAKDKADSLAEIYEAYEHWKELGN